jgi:hypothetical protein
MLRPNSSLMELHVCLRVHLQMMKNTGDSFMKCRSVIYTLILCMMLSLRKLDSLKQKSLK